MWYICYSPEYVTWPLINDIFHKIINRYVICSFLKVLRKYNSNRYTITAQRKYFCTFHLPIQCSISPQNAWNCDEVSLFLVVFKRINRLIRNLYSEFFGKFILKHYEEQMQVKSFQCVQKLIETSYFHQMNKRRHCRISHQCAGGSRRRK